MIKPQSTMGDFGEWLLGLLEKGFSLLLVGAWWTGFLEIVSGFWDGANNLLITLMDRVTQHTIDDTFTMAGYVLMCLTVVVVISTQQAVLYSLKYPVRILMSVVYGLCTLVAWVMNQALPEPPVVPEPPLLQLHDNLAWPALPEALVLPNEHVPIRSHCLRMTWKGTPCMQQTWDNKACWRTHPHPAPG